jgi:chemotaxis protein methyltransferase CheR
MLCPELAQMLADWAGIEMTRGGIDHAAEEYVAYRLRQLRISKAEYLGLLWGRQSPEFQALIDAITVTYTWFLRDSPQLYAIAQLLRELPAHGRPLQVWVAGCATGEDVYSLALLAADVERPIEILGTDLNSRALAVARDGRYGAFSVRELPARFANCFTRIDTGQWLIAPELRKNVRFGLGNLTESPPVPQSGGGWDLILCRNVLIYFARERAHAVFEMLSQALRPGGYLLVGSSEIVLDVPTELEAVYAGDRLAFRRRGVAKPSTESSGVPVRHRSLVPTRPKERWVGPLPALPPSAADAVHPAATAAAQAPARPGAVAREFELERAHALLDRGELGEALELYLAAVSREPSDPEAHAYAGITYYLRSEIELAVHELRAALLLDPNSWVPTFYLALCYETKGLVDEAAREYRRVVALSERLSRNSASVAALRPWHADLLHLAKVRARAE